MKKNKSKSILCIIIAMLASAFFAGSVFIDANANDYSVGDANCDGSITVGDATYVSQFLNGGFTVNDLTPLDANLNKVVSKVDVQEILDIYATNAVG